MPMGFRADGSRLGFQKGHKRFDGANSFKTGKDNPAYGNNQTGENNFNWKGDNTSKRNFHKWVESRKGKPMKCDVCGTTDASRYDWSNKDHKYTRNLDDYTRMCRKCHYAYDKQRFGYETLRTYRTK